MTSRTIPAGARAPSNAVRDHGIGRHEGAIRNVLGDLFRSLCAVWDGSAWTPGRHSLTRVEDWDHPQTPR